MVAGVAKERSPSNLTARAAPNGEMSTKFSSMVEDRLMNDSLIFNNNEKILIQSDSYK
jgi:hypothetical protein